jgi:hypothetical protein
MKRHPFRPTPFVLGIVFSVLAVLFALDAGGEVDLDLRWIPAVVLIGLGLATVLGGLARSRPAPPNPPEAITPGNPEPE